MESMCIPGIMLQDVIFKKTIQWLLHLCEIFD